MSAFGGKADSLRVLAPRTLERSLIVGSFRRFNVNAPHGRFALGAERTTVRHFHR